MGPTKKEIVLLNPQLEKHWVEVIGEPVWYNDTVAIMGFITDIKISKSELETDRVTRLHELMLEINHSLVEVEDIQRTFHLILTNALKAIKNASLGSIMTVKDDHLKPCLISVLEMTSCSLSYRLPIHFCIDPPMGLWIALPIFLIFNMMTCFINHNLCR